MNANEAASLLMMLDSVDRYARKYGAEERAARVAGAAAAWARIDGRWAVGWVRGELADGRVPAIPDVASAWRSEAAVRVQQPIPTAPPEIEADGARWVTWERARRQCLLAGDGPLAAAQAADRLVGAAVRPAITAGPDGDPTEQQARIGAAIDGYLARRAARLSDEDADEEAGR